MLKALVIKELRESAGIIALAVLAAVFALTSLTGLPLVPVDAIGEDGFPFVSGSFPWAMGWIVGVTAAALGLKQTAWESAHNTYHFLLHRPVSRQFIFGTKLLVGTAVVLTLGAVMTVVFALWAAGTGNVATPFFWSMTAPTWQLLISLPLVYLGAFLSGIRPARWFGSRLGPLVAAGVAVLVVSWLWWWWLELMLVIVLAGIGLSAIFFHVAHRDY